MTDESDINESKESDLGDMEMERYPVSDATSPLKKPAQLMPAQAFPDLRTFFLDAVFGF